MVVAPTSVERLQLVCANAARDGACLLLLNPRLALPSPVAAGATMAPLLLSDFERIYEASADALRVAGPGDHGVALHRRWPDKRYRLFARDGDRFDFVGNSARRPGADQLRAIYAETTRHRVYDGSRAFSTHAATSPGRARRRDGSQPFVDGGWAVANRTGVCTAPMHVRPSSDTATKAMPTRRPTAASGVRRTPAGVAGASARRRRGARRRAGAARRRLRLWEINQ